MEENRYVKTVKPKEVWNKNGSSFKMSMIESRSMSKNNFAVSNYEGVVIVLQW